MEEPKKSFDPYAEWLQIATQRRPPNHYELLGLDAFEDNEQRIDEAAKRRAAYLHQLAAGPRRKEVQQLLGEVAAARRTLVNEKSRAAYNQELKSRSASPPPSIRLPGDSGERGPGRESGPSKARPRVDSYLLAAGLGLLAIVIGVVLVSRSGDRSNVDPRDHTITPHQEALAKRKRAFDSLADVSQSSSLPVQQGDQASRGRDTKSRRGANRAKKSTPNVISVPKGWWRGAPMSCDFSDPSAIPFDAQAITEQGWRVSNERLVMPRASGDRVSVLPMAADRRLEPGEAISLSTRIVSDGNKTRVGVTTGGIALVMRVEPMRTQERLTLRSAGDVLLGDFEPPGAAELTLTVGRSAAIGDELWWIVAFRSRVYGGRLKLRIGEEGQGLGIVWFCDGPTNKTAPWIDDLRFGSCSAPASLSTAPRVVIQGSTSN